MARKTPSSPAAQLAGWLAAVERTLQDKRALLNQADPINGNHGDHMVEIFATASQAAAGRLDLPMPEALLLAAQALEDLPGNGSAEVYGRGLRHFAEQFHRRHVELKDLAGYVRQVLSSDVAAPGGHNAEVLKALVNGLAGWAQSEPLPDGGQAAPYKLSMGALVEFGLAYLQARQRGGSKPQVVADAAASISPLGRIPHRYQSARLAIEALLNAILAGSTR